MNLKTQISWTDATLNPTTGCTKVSAGCEHCYAEALTRRLFGGNFDQIKLWPDRLAQVSRMTALVDEPTKQRRPRRVFVNSMSDLFHKEIDDAFRDRCFDAFEQQQEAAFQILTKRQLTMARYVERRYRSGVPQHIWLGVSCEDNKVRGRLDVLRRMKDTVGHFTAFVSVEPLIGACDRHDYRDLDWILIGGESGGEARPMSIEWARCAFVLARQAGAAVWFKQFGTWKNNPLYQQADAPDHVGRVRQAIRAGEQAAHIVTDPKTGRLTVAAT